MSDFLTWQVENGYLLAKKTEHGIVALRPQIFTWELIVGTRQWVNDGY